MDCWMKRICTICARGGSKGVSGKNIRDMAGKPLIAYSILQAKSSGLFEKIAVSSDSRTILDAAQEWGADCLIERPVELATDNSSKLPAIRHCVEEAEKVLNNNFDIVVDLDVTSPLRTTDDIRGAVELLEKKNVGNVITGTPARRSPYFNMVELNQQGVVRLVKSPGIPVVCRQDAPECFDMNASIYVWHREVLSKSEGVFNEDTLLFKMPEERSVDIDSELDFKVVEFLISKNKSLFSETNKGGRTNV
jgi:N-acylneuraminate cytidylyltransferase/CMP-N,N'-diacetyllegionaminic acid synthase